MKITNIWNSIKTILYFAVGGIDVLELQIL